MPQLPYGVIFPSSSSGKSWSRTATGSPLGRHERPSRRNGPGCSFFFPSTLMTGSPAARYSAIIALTCPNRASRSGCRLPSIVRDIPCRLQPSARIIRATASFPHRNPRAASCRSRSRSDREHQVISAIGSPRADASASSRSARLNPGWASWGLLPAPARPPRPPRRQLLQLPGPDPGHPRRHHGL